MEEERVFKSHTIFLSVVRFNELLVSSTFSIWIFFLMQGTSGHILNSAHLNFNQLTQGKKKPG